MRKFIIVAMLFLLPSTALAAQTLTERPHWSLEVKGGQFYPDIENWKDYYGSDRTTHFAGSLAYKVLRQLEVGIEGGYIRDKGHGFAPLHGTITGNVTYELFPLQAFALFRGVFNEEQWFVPYAGGGWTRMYYRDKIEYQATVRGSVDGYHARGGVQLLLDNVDPSAATNFYLDYGVRHTYFFLEAQYIRAMAETTTGESVNLGGVSYLGGLLFEF